GLQIEVTDLGANDAPVFELSQHTTPLPALDVAGCDPRRDGWIVKGDGLTYLNRSNALPGAQCAAASARGLRRVELTDHRTTSGTIDFRVVVKKATIATPVGPLRGSVVLGGSAADGAAGRCGGHDFAPGLCKSAGEHHQLSCRPR